MGIEEAHRKWSDNKQSFISRELLDHLVDKVIPHEFVLPTEAPITAPTLPTLQKVVTLTDSAINPPASLCLSINFIENWLNDLEKHFARRCCAYQERIK